MLKQERQQTILKILEEKTYASVDFLSKTLYASPPTIRRDLNELEKSGMIVKNHGGAMHAAEGTYQIPWDFRSGLNIHEKLEMCKKAANLISDGDTVYIDASTSVINIADYITAKNVIVVTNGMPLAMLLCKKSIKTYLIGGEVSPFSMGSIGEIAKDMLSLFHFNTVFFSSYGINEKGIIVDTSLSEVLMRKEAFKNCDKKVFLHTKNKENLSAPYNVIPIKDVEIVIS